MSQVYPVQNKPTTASRRNVDDTCRWSVEHSVFGFYGAATQILTGKDIDKFTKWVEIIPTRAAIKHFHERVIARTGTPRVFISDNGSQYTSKKFKDFLHKRNIRQQLTAPYTLQENPTERSKRVIKTMIAQYVDKSQRTWDCYIPKITFAINTSLSTSTGLSANYHN